jgi:hypothetical protein
VGRAYDRATFIAGEWNALDDVDRPMLVDVGDAAANVPCILLGPPRRTGYRAGGAAVDVEWRAIILSSGPPTFGSWVDLDDLAEIVEREFPVVSIDPGVFPLVPGQEPFACYVVTFTDTL